MFSYWAPPASRPLPRRTARSMLSFGTELFFAFWIASNNVGLPAWSPPPVRAATSTFLISLANSLPRLASSTAFLCLVVAHLEWPLMCCPSQSLRIADECAGPESARGGRPQPAIAPAGRRRSCPCWPPYPERSRLLRPVPPTAPG